MLIGFLCLFGLGCLMWSLDVAKQGMMNEFEQFGYKED